MEQKEKKLFIEAQRGNKDALEKIYLKYEALIYDQLIQEQKSSSFNVEYEDMKQSLSETMLLAIKSFDVNKGIKFSTYCYPCLKFARINERNKNKINRLCRSDLLNYYAINKLKKNNPQITEEEICNKLNIPLLTLNRIRNLMSGIVSFDKPMDTEDEDITLIESIADNKDDYKDLIDKIVIEQYINTLSDIQKKIIYMQFYEGMSQTQIGKILNCSQTYISRMTIKALKKIRINLEKNF